MMTLLATSIEGIRPTIAVLLLVQFLAFAVFLARCGFFAWVLSFMLGGLTHGPITADTSAFYFETGILGLAFLFVLALYGFVQCIGGHGVLLSRLGLVNSDHTNRLAPN